MDNGQYGQNITDSGVKTVTLPEAGAQSGSIAPGGSALPHRSLGDCWYATNTKMHYYAPRQELKHGAVAGAKHSNDRLALRNISMPCRREREGAVRSSLVRGTAQAHLRAPQHETGHVEVRFLWGATGGSWALQRQRQAGTKVGESWLRSAFSSHRDKQDSGIGLSKTSQ